MGQPVAAEGRKTGGTMRALLNQCATNRALGQAFACIDRLVGGCTAQGEHIAQSPSSTVYRLFSGRYNSDVAVKIVDLTALPAKYADTFLKREIEVCKCISHPFICHTYDVFYPHPTQVVFLFQYYNGGTMLDMILKHNNFSEPQSAIIFRQLIEALKYLHDNHIVHRDVKLENILFDKYGNVKVADFGFARRMRSKLERSRSFCGTKPYSCPDVVRNKEYDPFANDWYSAGVVLYTLISGRWPYNLQEMEHVNAVVWPTIRFPPDLFTSEAADLLALLLHENAYLRADYQVCVGSAFMVRNRQGFDRAPVVRSVYNTLLL